MQPDVRLVCRQHAGGGAAHELGVLHCLPQIEVRHDLLHGPRLLLHAVEVLPQNGLTFGLFLGLPALLLDRVRLLQLPGHLHADAHFERLVLEVAVVLGHGLAERVQIETAVVARLDAVLLAQDTQYGGKLLHLLVGRVLCFGGRLAAFRHHLLELVLVLLLGEEGVPLVAAAVIGGLSLRFLRRLGGLCSLDRRFLRGRCLAPFPVHALFVSLCVFAGHAQRFQIPPGVGGIVARFSRAFAAVASGSAVREKLQAVKITEFAH